jgi:hypothetical protein
MAQGRSDQLVELTRLLTQPIGTATAALSGRGSAEASALTALAREHGVEAWLAGCAPLAEPAWAELAAQRSRFLAGQARTLAVVRDLDPLLAGIDWLVLKGPALAYTVYPRPQLRSYVDLDLLVPPDRFGQVLQRLESAGYHLADRNWPLLQDYRPGELRVRSPRGILLDVHWSVFNDARRRSAFSLDTAGLLARRRRLEPVGLPALGPVAQVLHVGLHAALSGGNRLGWLLDLHLCAAGADWPSLIEAARAAGAGPALALMLERARRCLGTEVPPAALTGLAGGAGRLAVLRALDRGPLLAADPQQPSLARSVARSMRHSVGASLVELTRHAGRWVGTGAPRRYVRPGWREADNPRSALADVPDPAARQRLLAWIAGQR